MATKYPLCFSDCVVDFKFTFASCVAESSYRLDVHINPLTPNDHYSGRTAPLTSKRCILYIYSTNIGTEVFNMVYTHRFFLFKMEFVS